MAVVVSPRYQLNKQDLAKVGRGLGVAVVGAVLTYLAEQIPNVDFGNFTPLAVTGFSVIANIIRKWISENTYK